MTNTDLDIINPEYVPGLPDVPAVPVSPLPISFVDDPEQFLEEATVQAKVLKNFLIKTKSVVKIGPGEHVKVGGWQFLAQLAGLSVGTTAEPITLGDDSGWKAHAIVYRNGEPTGVTADALCLRSEANWKNSDTYAICSMAQTRAISKAIKGLLGFVVVMAGYSDTPAEEMPKPEKRSSVRQRIDKVEAKQKRIMELAVAADEKRGETKTADEVNATIKEIWNAKTLNELTEIQLTNLGQDLKQWLEAGCTGEFKIVPF